MSSTQIDLIVFHLYELLCVPESIRLVLLSQLEKDQIDIAVLTNGTTRAAKDMLRDASLLGYIDFIHTKESLALAESDLLRRLAAPSTLIIEHAHQMTYAHVLTFLGERQRQVPKWVLGLSEGLD